MSHRTRRACITFGIVFGMTLLAGAQGLAGAQEKGVPQSGKDPAKKTKTPRKRKRRPRRGLSPGKVLVLRFDRSAPQIGDPLPDVAGYDADGKPFSLRSLKGHYTVLTCGCLT
ncbi:MAG: hypothetical protein ACE5KM_10395 [Planctomycetaceae bacterium]